MTTTQNTESTTQYEVGTTVRVDPTDLLIQRNIRTIDPSRDKAFGALVKSITEVGVKQPIVAVITAEDRLLVRMGERRTLAAIQASSATVPVYIEGIDSQADEAEVARIIEQRDENTHRAGLTTAEEVGVVEQLAAFGLSPAQIAKKARIKRSDVDTALVVAESKLARKASERYTELTLDQAAVVAEFEAEAETVKALIADAATGQFDHVAQRARDERDKAAAKEALLATLAEAGVTVIENPGYDNKTTRRLDSLRVSAEDKTRLTEEAHRDCPGHVAWIGSDWTTIGANGDPIEYPDEPDTDEPDEDDPNYETVRAAWDAYEAAYAKVQAESRRVERAVPIYGCAKWRDNGHQDAYAYGSASSTTPRASEMSEEDREAAKAARRLVIENNKAWAATQPVRRAWLATLAKAKTPPKGTAAFLATALAKDPGVLNSVAANHLAAEWLGKKAGEYGRADLSPAKSTTDQRSLVLALVQVLAGYEDDLTDHTWRSNGTANAAGRYLRFVAAAGYGLSDVEKYAMSAKTA